MSTENKPLGTLIYHLGTCCIVSGLEHHASLQAAIETAGVEQAQRPAYLQRAPGLATNGTTEERP